MADLFYSIMFGIVIFVLVVMGINAFEKEEEIRNKEVQNLISYEFIDE